MRYFKSIIVLIAVFCSTASWGVEKSTNYPLYSLKNVISHEVSQDAGTLFTLERNDAGNLFVSRDLASGAETMSVQIEMPEAYFMNTVIVDGDIYVFQANILDREKRLMETLIFKINSVNGQLERIYQSQEMLGFAERFYVTGNGLLLTEKRGNRPFLFDLETNEMKAIDLDEDLRVRSFDLEKNCAVIIRQSDFSTSFKGGSEKSSYTEGDGSLLGVFICDFSNEFILTEVGQYQPSYILSQNKDEEFLPHFIIEDNDYAWVGPSYMVNRFPIYPGALIGDSVLFSTWESLVGYERINKISFVGDNYVIADQFSEMGETSLVVFNIKSPNTEKAETVSQEDRESIKSLLRGKSTTEKSILNPEIISQVFNADFYKIDIITTTVEISEDGKFTFSSTESFMAVARDGDYSVFKKNDELVTYISNDFVLNEKSAPLFQDALDVLFPMGHFAEKHKTFYQQGDQWVFVRDESFGDKIGIAVKVNGDGKVITVEPEGKTSP